MNHINKENANPSPASGKQANTHFQHDPSLFKDQIDTFEHQILVENIEQRLCAWYSYLNYLKQFSHEELKDNQIRLQTLYSRCLDKCKGILKIRPNDEKFTKIFIEYTTKYDVRPLKMFEWGSRHRVGEFQSIFYMEWAKVLANSENPEFEKAVEVLSTGLEKKAQPADVLEEYLKKIVNAKSVYERSNVAKKEQAQVPEEKAVSSVAKLEAAVKAPEQEQPTGKKSFAFYYDLIKPNRHNDKEEYSFEEMRARDHYKNHEKLLKCQSEFNKQLEELKNKISELEESQLNNPRPETKEKISRLNKTRDSIMLPRNFKHVSLLQQSYNGDETERHSADNLTNVSNFSTWVTQLGSPENDEANENDGTLTHSDDKTEFDFSGLVEKSVNTTKHKMLDDIDLTGLTSKIYDKSEVVERSMDMLQPPAKKCNFTLGDETVNATLFNGAAGNMTNSCYPTPTTGKTMSETRNLIENVFNQTDTVCGNTTESICVPAQEKSSIFIYQDANNQYMETMKFPKMSELRNQDTTKDFSIFADKEESLVNSDSKPKGSKKYNEDGSLFVYPNSADSSLDNKRKPFQELAIRSASPASESIDIDFEPPIMASTCNFKQLRDQAKGKRDVEFEPTASSTCNFKNLKANSEKEREHERLLETIFDTTDTETDENSSESIEKEKMFNKFLGSIESGSNSNDAKDGKESPALEKILAEEVMTQNIRGGAFMQEMKGEKEPVNRKVNISSNVMPNGVGFEWDDLDLKGQINDTANDADDIDYQCLQFSPFPKDSNFNSGDYNENEYVLLTQDKLNTTFQNHCYKLCYADSTMGSQETTNFTQKLAQNQMEDLDNAQEKAEQSILAVKEPSSGSSSFRLELDVTACEEMTMHTLSNDKLKAAKLLEAMGDDTEKTERMGTTNNFTNVTSTNFTAAKFANKTTNLDSTSFDPDCSTLNSTSTCMMTTTNLNNTIFSAVRDPFNADVKNRVLVRNSNALSKKSNYKNLIVPHPIVNVKGIVSLMGNETYSVLENIGKGAFAKIYLIQNINDKERARKIALKVDSQATAWEFYITEAIHERLSEMVERKSMIIDVTKSYIRLEQFMKYKNGCFSTMSYYENGSLLDLINYHVQKEETFPYWFVLYLTLEMLNILDYLHKCKIIHADIKADNLLVDKLPDSLGYFEPHKTKCLILIDFNRSIDLTLLPEDSEFEAMAANKSLLCPEMKSHKTWTYQIDFYGILSCIHCLVFKKYLNVIQNKSINSITSTFPRNYDKVFAHMFETFLNIPDCQNIPDVQIDWIPQFVSLFKTELGASFSKSSKYLKDLNAQPLREVVNKKK